jgi:murein DD-endopeptidase MepM/ murein hydrolase activator NlpD
MQKTSGGQRAKRGRTGKKAPLGSREKKRLFQLGLCAVLFAVVFFGKGAAPVSGFGETLLELIRSDTDFHSAFAAVGEAVFQGEPVLDTLGKLAVEVFGAGQSQRSADSDDPVPAGLALTTLAQRPTSQTVLAQLHSSPVETADGGEEDQKSGEEEGQETQELETVQVPAYTGPELPEGYSMDYYDLGLSETVTPVLGTLTSSYGYRDHPVSGEYLFHAGVDLAAQTGTPVRAFAAGTVEYIGESEAYGLYIQLDHGNGVKTFYCHCSALYAQKGEQVALGQTIAAVGQTGNATGPHLHLEVKLDNVHLNPIYDVETAQG